jgi:hypothetical protein
MFPMEMCMRQSIAFGCGLVLATLSVAASPARAQTVAVGPYYATPSWDQKLQCDTQATCLRFVVLANWNNEAVLDRETGLVWERSPSVAKFPLLNTHCLGDVSAGGRRGWRTPTVNELSSLFDPSASSPALPPGHPFQNVQFGFLEEYWTTTAFGSASSRFILNFALGGIGDTGAGASLHIWCVRGGQVVDPQ